MLEMNRRAFASLLALGLAPGAAFSQGVSDPAAPAPVAPVNLGDLQGYAVIARNRSGRIVLETSGGLGVRGVGAARQTFPFKPDTKVRIASISKMVLSYGLMTLVSEGRLDLNADAADLAGFRLRHPKFPDTPITVAMLGSHRSGLRNGPDYPQPLGRSLSDLFTPGGKGYDGGAWFSPASEPPGKFYAYSDVNFAVLAQIIERVSGERFDTFMRKRVFEPLRLDCGYQWSGVSQKGRDGGSACCRIEHGLYTPNVDAVIPPAPEIKVLPAPEQGELTAADYILGQNGFVFAPQGGLRASVRDLDVLGRAISGRDDGRIALDDEVRAHLFTPLWKRDAAAGNGGEPAGLIQAYGFGCEIPLGRTPADGDAFFGPDSPDWRGHFGEAYGLVSGLFFNLKDQRQIAYVIGGTPVQAESVRSATSAASPWEQALFDMGLAKIGV